MRLPKTPRNESRSRPSTRETRAGKAAALNAEPLSIVMDPDPCLRAKAREVRRVNRRLRELIDRMAVTMYRANGVGLAAPQVGVPERIFLADDGDGLRVFINPEILATGEERETAWEGCLSIPTLQGEVERPTTVRVTALDADGRRFWLDAEGTLARVVQHETDHLDGVLFVDRATRISEIPLESRLRVVFCGTPGFAEEVLAVMVDAGIRPRLVITRPDRPRGRGQHLAPTPVRRLADALDIETWTPTRLRDEAFLAKLRELAPDAIVTAAYGRILPADMLAIPTLAAINVHASLLPRWRGAAPIQRALMAGDTVTGVTVMHMAEELDAGDIILQTPVPIEPGDDFGTLHDRLAAAGGEALVEALKALARGTAGRTPQDPAKATWAPPLEPEEEWIDWSRPAADVRNRIRALTPWPGAKCRRGDEIWKIRRVELAEPGDAADVRERGTREERGGGEEDAREGGTRERGASEQGAEPGMLAAVPRGVSPGTVVAIQAGRGFAVACGEGALWVTELQPEGRRSMSAADFLNGHPLHPGDRLAGLL